MATEKIKRMHFVDALRGLTMFLVVYHHVVLKCYSNMTLLEKALQSFRMPVFFFVSGFVAYKALDFWTGRNTAQRLANKFRVQVIPTVIFYCLYFFIIRSINPFQLFLQYGWRQYWFTFVLFEFFVLYFTANFLTRHSNRLNIGFLVALAAGGVAIYHGFEKSGNLCTWFAVSAVTCYFPFFVSGTLARRYFDFLRRLFDKWWVLLLVCLLFLVQVPMLDNLYNVPQRIANFFSIWSIRFTGMLMMFGLFLHFRDRFTLDGRCTRCMTFVGRRTLDIYLMHFFFVAYVPIAYRFIRDCGFAEYARPILLIVAAAIVAGCLLVSALLRKWKWLGRLLFAAKY